MNNFRGLLIIHYHIFKNAGTSVDTMLRINFGDRWTEAEFSDAVAPAHSNVCCVEDFLRDRPNLLALSSHTAQLPLPECDQDVFPIIFLRHPLDRLKSAYSFERVQEANTHGAQLAKNHDFSGYVQQLLTDVRFRQARNFQTRRLADYQPPEQGSEIERALKALESLPFVGLVEHYDRSIKRLGELLAPRFPNFQAIALHENKTPRQEESPEEGMQALSKLLPSDLFDKLIAANSDDFIVYEKAKERFR